MRYLQETVRIGIGRAQPTGQPGFACLAARPAPRAASFRQLSVVFERPFSRVSSDQFEFGKFGFYENFLNFMVNFHIIFVSNQSLFTFSSICQFFFAEFSFLTFIYVAC